MTSAAVQLRLPSWPFHIVIAVLVTVAPLHGQICTAQRVSRDDLAQAMSLHGDYDILATMNRGRFTTELLLRLAREAQQRDPDGGPLYVEPDDWFTAYLETAGITREEAPLSSRLGNLNRQWVMIEHRAPRVVAAVKKGPEPRLALSVRTWWPESENLASKFSFEDTIAEPRLKVTSHSEITYRLLEFEDMVLIDEMEGLTARPTSGLLGALFKLIGEASLKQSRMAVSPDGVQVARTRSSRLLSVTVTSTIDSDGKGRKGIPDGRMDLEEIAERLERDLEMEYVPTAWGRREVPCQGLPLGAVDQSAIADRLLLQPPTPSAMIRSPR